MLHNVRCARGGSTAARSLLETPPAPRRAASRRHASGAPATASRTAAGATYPPRVPQITRSCTQSLSQSYFTVREVETIFCTPKTLELSVY